MLPGFKACCLPAPCSAHHEAQQGDVPAARAAPASAAAAAVPQHPDAPASIASKGPLVRMGYMIIVFTRCHSITWARPCVCFGLDQLKLFGLQPQLCEHKATTTRCDVGTLTLKGRQRHLPGAIGAYGFSRGSISQNWDFMAATTHTPTHSLPPTPRTLFADAASTGHAWCATRAWCCTCHLTFCSRRSAGWSCMTSAW